MQNFKKIKNFENFNRYGERILSETLRELISANIEIIYNSTVTKLNAEKKLQSIEVTNKDGSVKTIEVNGLFVAIGRIPENQNFAKLVNLDNWTYDELKSTVIKSHFFDGFFDAAGLSEEDLNYIVNGHSPVRVNSNGDEYMLYTIHHIKPLNCGGETRPSNLIPLPRAFHTFIHEKVFDPQLAKLKCGETAEKQYRTGLYRPV